MVKRIMVECLHPSPHRACEGKSEVRIYDYVEPDHPLTAHMHRKRMAAFRSMGYRRIDEEALLP